MNKILLVQPMIHDRNFFEKQIHYVSGIWGEQNRQKKQEKIVMITYITSSHFYDLVLEISICDLIEPASDKTAVMITFLKFIFPVLVYYPIWKYWFYKIIHQALNSAQVSLFETPTDVLICRLSHHCATGTSVTSSKPSETWRQRVQFGGGK